jgi:anti-sigma factor ChrR (cupin superfamily)
VTEQDLPQDWLEQAAAYALGALEANDRAVFEQRLAAGVTGLQHMTSEFQSVVDHLHWALAPVAPRASLRERVLAHVSQEHDHEVDVFDRTLDQVMRAVPPAPPAPDLRDRLLARIAALNDASAAAPEPLTFVKASEGRWRELAPGITAKVLFLDPISRRATALVRMAPGTTYAPHRHTEAEELYVLEGGCLCGGRTLFDGDYHRAEAGTEHHDTSSADGCLLLVISSPQNEMLA